MSLIWPACLQGTAKMDKLAEKLKAAEISAKAQQRGMLSAVR